MWVHSKVLPEKGYACTLSFLCATHVCDVGSLSKACVHTFACTLLKATSSFPHKYSCDAHHFLLSHVCVWFYIIILSTLFLFFPCTSYTCKPSLIHARVRKFWVLLKQAWTVGAMAYVVPLENWRRLSWRFVLNQQQQAPGKWQAGTSMTMKHNQLTYCRSQGCLLVMCVINSFVLQHLENAVENM